MPPCSYRLSLVLRACQALDGEELELQAMDGVDPLRDDYADESNLAELEGRLRGNEFFRDCLATRTVTLKVCLSLARIEVAVLITCVQCC